MHVDDTKLAILQALTDRVSSIHQIARQQGVLDDLRNKPMRTARVFEDEAGRQTFLAEVDQLVALGLVEQKMHRGETCLKLTEDAVHVHNLNIYGLL